MNIEKATEKEIIEYVVKELQVLFDVGLELRHNSPDNNQFSHGIYSGITMGAFMIMNDLHKKFGIEIEMFEKLPKR